MLTKNALSTNIGDIMEKYSVLIVAIVAVLGISAMVFLGVVNAPSNDTGAALRSVSAPETLKKAADPVLFSYEDVTVYESGRVIAPSSPLLYAGNGSNDTNTTVQCGDINYDGLIDIDDVTFLVDYVFSGGPAPQPAWIGDMNGNGGIDVDDIVYLIDYVFSGGPAPVCASCEDSDGGIRPWVAGNIDFLYQGNYFNRPDLCENDSMVLERYCSGTEARSILQYCGGSSFCEQTAYGAQCVNQTNQTNTTAWCQEDDGGNKLFLRGNTWGQYSSGEDYFLTDYCQDSDTIKEYWCQGDVNRILSTYSCSSYDPDWVCIEGACVTNTTGNQTTYCGDGVCNGNETYQTCPTDCPDTTPPQLVGSVDSVYQDNTSNGTIYTLHILRTYRDPESGMRQVTIDIDGYNAQGQQVDGAQSTEWCNGSVECTEVLDYQYYQAPPYQPLTWNISSHGVNMIGMTHWDWYNYP